MIVGMVFAGRACLSIAVIVLAPAALSVRTIISITWDCALSHAQKTHDKKVPCVTLAHMTVMNVKGHWINAQGVSQDFSWKMGNARSSVPLTHMQTPMERCACPAVRIALDARQAQRVPNVVGASGHMKEYASRNVQSDTLKETARAPNVRFTDAEHANPHMSVIAASPDSITISKRDAEVNVDWRISLMSKVNAALAHQTVPSVALLNNAESARLLLSFTKGSAKQRVQRASTLKEVHASDVQELVCLAHRRPTVLSVQLMNLAAVSQS